MIVLIPKSNHAQREWVKDYKSIFYYNVIYKVIAKILAGYFAPVLEDIIDLMYTGGSTCWFGGAMTPPNLHDYPI